MPSRQRQQRFDNHELSPTVLISPYGLQILDALFRIKTKKLAAYKSALSFCQDFDLSQPKLSKMMSSLNASNLSELRQNISKLKTAWWDSAFRYPLAKRKMMPFWILFQSYRALKPSSLEELLEFPNTTIGPLSGAQKFGYLKSTIQTLWVDDHALSGFKKKFRLVPSESAIDSQEGQSVLWIASSKHGLLKEGIITNEKVISNSPKSFLTGKLNSFRLFYDLSFFDERSREARNQLMKEILNAD